MQSDVAPNISRRKLRIAGIVGALIAVGLVVVGITTRASGNARLREWTNEQAVPTVSVTTPGTQGDGAALELPGRLEAYSRAPLYARVSGYLKSWSVDIGAPVKTGQLLAEIETPDLDQQLLQAKADLATAQANAALASTTAKRWQSMQGSDSVSKQEVDEKVGDYNAKQAMVNAAKANLDRIQALKGFTRIVAPFDGIVTARQTDVGALINVGGAAGQELFVVSDTKKLRVYVSVPQNYVPLIPNGTKATITVPEHPGKTYTAMVESSSQAVNAASGSTLMQLGVDNANGELMPGGFANVSLALPRNDLALNIPSSALMFGKSGLQVATVGTDNKIVLKPVTIARDLGSTIQLASGLDANDRVIDSPPDGVSNGDVVHVADKDPKTGEVATTKAGKSGNDKG